MLIDPTKTYLDTLCRFGAPEPYGERVFRQKNWHGVPNGIFIWYALTPPVLVEAALRNPIALVFIAEAFFLMFLFAWLIGRLGLRRPGRLAFIAMSLIGSMAFSVPAALWLAGRSKRTED